MTKKKEEPIDDEFLKENKFIFKKYKPIAKLDHGSFGNIYKVIRLMDKKEFALKIEKKISAYKYLESEAYNLFTLQNGFGFPKLISFGKIKKYNILIETLLGKSLYNIYFKTERRCNIADTCLIGLQILDRLEYIHSQNLVYRDVKPENFLIGIDDPNIIYIIDFGLCKKYRTSKTGKHILPKLTNRFNGTISYVSPNVFKGKEASRRDDLISLGYMLLYLIRKNIPKFPYFKDLNRQQYYEILLFKESYDEGKLFKDLPKEINEYIKYTNNLKFEQDPDYSYLRSLFTNILSRISLNYSNILFSWIDPSKKDLLGIPKNNSLKRRSPINRIYKRMFDKIKNKGNLKKIVFNITDINNLTKPKPNDKNRCFSPIFLNNYINSSKYVNNDKTNLIINDNCQYNKFFPINKNKSYNCTKITSNNNIKQVNSNQNCKIIRINPDNGLSQKSSIKHEVIFAQNNIKKNNQVSSNRNFYIPKNLENSSINYMEKPISKVFMNFRSINPRFKIMHNSGEYSLKSENIIKTNKRLENKIQSLRNVNDMCKINKIIHLKDKLFNIFELNIFIKYINLFFIIKNIDF